MTERIAIVFGSIAPIPPVRGIAPGIVLYNTVENLDIDNLVVFSRWEPELEQLEYDREKYRAVKVGLFSKFLVKVSSLIPYRIRRSFLKRLFFTTNVTSLEYYVSVGRQVKAYKPDIIFVHVSYGLVYFLHLLCPKSKIIYYHHGSNMHVKLSRINWARLQEASNGGIIAVSQAAFTGLEQTYGNIEIPHWVVHNGINPDLFNEDIKFRDRSKSRSDYGINHDDFVFGYVGRIAKSKGLWELLLAFDTIHKEYPKTKLVIIGSAEKENTPDLDFENCLKKRALLLGDAVKFLGFIPNDNLPHFLSMFDIGILPSLVIEGIPLAILEYMACGIPVIASNVGGIVEVIENEISGLLLDPQNVNNELPKAMSRYISDTKFFNNCCKSAATRARGFTYRSVAVNLMEIIRIVSRGNQ